MHSPPPSQPAESFSLTGRVAVVTGASSGIGRSLARALAGAGARVVLIARTETALQQTVTELAHANLQASAVTADLAQLETIEHIAAAAGEPFGTPDILVNAAGINLREPVAEVTPETWQATLTINLSVPFFLARALSGAMAERGWGRVINIASLQSRRAFPDSISYGASKGGVEQLTRAMAEAWSPAGICCNAIAPGFFPTALTASLFADPDKTAQAARQTAIGRNGELDDLSGAAVFLASAASDYVTGQILFVDGGFTAK